MDIVVDFLGSPQANNISSVIFLKVEEFFGKSNVSETAGLEAR
jgi:hypothetical protein